MTQRVRPVTIRGSAARLFIRQRWHAAVIRDEGDRCDPSRHEERKCDEKQQVQPPVRNRVEDDASEECRGNDHVRDDP